MIYFGGKAYTCFRDSW